VLVKKDQAQAQLLVEKAQVHRLKGDPHAFFFSLIFISVGRPFFLKKKKHKQQVICYLLILINFFLLCPTILVLCGVFIFKKLKYSSTTFINTIKSNFVIYKLKFIIFNSTKTYLVDFDFDLNSSLVFKSTLISHPIISSLIHIYTISISIFSHKKILIVNFFSNLHEVFPSFSTVLLATKKWVAQ
jgi:hypothetical protein